MNRGEIERTLTIDDDGSIVVHSHGLSLEGREMKWKETVDSRLLTPEDTQELRRLCEQTEELHRRAQRLAEAVLDPDRNEKLDRVLDELSVARDRLADLLEVLTIAQHTQDQETEGASDG